VHAPFNRAIEREVRVDPSHTRPERLTVSGLSMSFGGTTALDRVSCVVGAGEICGLIGPNGAGKTTLFNCVTGVVRASGGSVRLGDVELLQARPREISGHGVARTFQNVVLLNDLDILQNVMLGGVAQRSAGVFRSIVRRHADRDDRERAAELLDRLRIGEVANRRPGELPFGTLKRVELARALMSRPQLLLLDEPANGLTSAEVGELGRLLAELNRTESTSILLVEHHMGLVRSVADHVVVLNYGRVIADGTADWACAQPEVVEAYLGAAA
jgi:branched-chain amino acid transport system ATP-binding protein